MPGPTDAQAINAATATSWALASALSTIAEVGSHEAAADVEGSTAAMCIFGGERGLLASVFATHPPVERRIERLTAMA